MSVPAQESHPGAANAKFKSRARLLWLAGLCVYVFAVWHYGWRNVANAVVGVQPAYLAAAIAVELAILWLRAAKWRYALGPGASAVAMFFISKATGSWTPGRLGELSPLLLPQFRSPRYGAWIVVDRLLEGSATLVVGLLGVSMLSLGQNAALGPKKEYLALLVIAFVCLAILPSYILTRRTWFARAAARFREGSALNRLLRWMERVSIEALLLKRKLLLSATITLSATCLDVALGMLFWRAFGANLSFSLLATVQCVFGLISAIPVTPTASGAPYLAAGVMLYEAVGLAPEVYTGGVALHIVIQSLVFWSSFACAMSLFKGKPS